MFGRRLLVVNQNYFQACDFVKWSLLIFDMQMVDN